MKHSNSSQSTSSESITPGLIPCVIYTRVSTDEQAKEEHYSLSAQEKYCMEEIKRRERDGWFHLATLSDPGFSGERFDRPGLLEMLALIKAGKVGIVVIYKRERLFRNVDLAVKVQAILDLHQVKVFSVVEGVHDSAPHSVLMRQIIDAQAEYERANGRRRQHDCLRFAAEKGIWQGGNAAYGYKYEKIMRTLSILEEEAKHVRYIFVQISEGKHPSFVARALRDMGVRGRPTKFAPSDPNRRAYFTADWIRRMIRLGAREHLGRKQYDIVILDLVIPNRDDEEPEPDGGFEVAPN